MTSTQKTVNETSAVVAAHNSRPEVQAGLEPEWVQSPEAATNEQKRIALSGVKGKFRAILLLLVIGSVAYALAQMFRRPLPPTPLQRALMTERQAQRMADHRTEVSQRVSDEQARGFWKQLMPKKNKQPNRRFGSFWNCLTCEGSPAFEHADMMKHFKDVHGIDPKTTMGKKSAITHMDGDTWFSWDYEWEIGDVKAHQHTCQERRGESAALWR